MRILYPKEEIIKYLRTCRRCNEVFKTTGRTARVCDNCNKVINKKEYNKCWVWDKEKKLIILTNVRG